MVAWFRWEDVQSWPGMGRAMPMMPSVSESSLAAGASSMRELGITTSPYPMVSLPT